jgi:probable phosphoglycerate mutase
LLVVILGAVALLSGAIIGAAALDAWRSARGRVARRADAVVDVRVEPRHLVLVRHGRTEWSLLGKHTSRTDPPLTDRGREEAAAMTAQLDDWRFDRILVSPSRRARETLELLDRVEPVTVLDDLREWDYGDDEGRTTAEIRVDRPGWTIWDGPRHGESLAQVAARARRVLDQADGDVLVVGHGHQLRVLAACWLGLDPAAGRLLALDPATISILGHEHEQRILTAWNVSPPPA